MNIRVLIADPERELLDAYRDYLSGQDFEVQTAPSGQNCVDKLQSWRPNVLILEPDMPDGWGDKILKTVREDPLASRVPVLILSRCDSKAIDYPVREYHVKPFSLAKLTRGIRKAVMEPSIEYCENYDR